MAEEQSAYGAYDQADATQWTQYPDPTQRMPAQQTPWQAQQVSPQQVPYQGPYQPVPQATPQQVPSQASAYPQAMTGQQPYPQPQPSYGQPQMPQTPYGQGYAGQQPYGQYGQYNQYGQYGQPQPYGQQPYMADSGIPMASGGYDPLAKNAYICLAIGIVGILLLFVGRVWGIIFCCLGISLGVKGIYSRARIAAIIGIVLNSISLLISILSLVATCSGMG